MTNPRGRTGIMLCLRSEGTGEKICCAGTVWAKQVRRWQQWNKLQDTTSRGIRPLSLEEVWVMWELWLKLSETGLQKRSSSSKDWVPAQWHQVAGARREHAHRSQNQPRLLGGEQLLSPWQEEQAEVPSLTLFCWSCHPDRARRQIIDNYHFQWLWLTIIK